MTAATIDEDRPTLGESYGIATTTSNMRLDSVHRTPADLILAAGMLPPEHRLGVLLLRLRAEHDGIVSQMQLVDDLARDRSRQAAEVLKESSRKNRTQSEAEEGRALAEVIRKRSATEILMARVAVLEKLGSLDEAKQEVGRFACVMATKLRFMKPDNIVAIIAGQVLSVFLDPLCHHCDGTGRQGSEYKGGIGVLCKPCNGTAHRRTQIGNNDDARAFGWALLLQLDRATSQAASAMAVRLSSQ